MAKPLDRYINNGSAHFWPWDTPPRDVYVAAPMSQQGVAAQVALRLIDAGLNVTSSWIRKDFWDCPDRETSTKAFEEYEAHWGSVDLDDVRRSDTLVILATRPSTSGGYHVELGYFLGLGKTNVIVVVERSNPFFYTENVRWAKNDAALVVLLTFEAAVAPPLLSEEEIKASVRAFADAMEDPGSPPADVVLDNLNSPLPLGEEAPF